MSMSDSALSRAVVVISDRIEHGSELDNSLQQTMPAGPSFGAARPEVVGGYLERLPLAAVRAGAVEFAEIWHHRTAAVSSSFLETEHLTRRVFPVDATEAPFSSRAMLEFIERHGAPRILCIWGLGVSEEIIEACRDSFIIYNSIDAPALRVPESVSRHFDLVLTGAQWQSDEVQHRHPHMATAILPVGPEFASPETFFPTGAEKLYDVIYVAAAQAYKRHDILFSAMARSPRRLKALCVMGYGEDEPALRQLAADLDIDVEFVGPPGVPYDEVNRLMNLARVGVVCGVDDGAPAILTEYMLAGLPVVANAALACGLQYILPETGIRVAADRFEQGIIEALDHPDRFTGRQVVLDRWAWPHSIARLHGLIDPSPSFAHHLSPAHSEGGVLEPATTA